MNLNLTWATESGHALDLLRQFTDSCFQKGFAINSIAPLNEQLTFTKGIWIIFLSTTGQGAPPYSMRSLWRQMMKKNYKIEAGIKFSVYSLGDRGYGQNFGLAGRKFRQRLRMLGAQELLQIGLGDDQDAKGYRQVYASGWSQKLLQSMKGLVKEGNSHIGINKIDLIQQNQATVVKVEELGNRQGRKVYWIQLEMNNNQIKEGDVLEIFPHNRVEDVEFLLKYFQKNGEEIVNFFGQTKNLKDILFKYANISSMLNYYFFSSSQKQQLINLTHNQLHKSKIQEFSQNYEEYFNFICKYKRNIVQFIKDFDIKLSLQYFLQYINLVIGRKYSIARVQGNRVWILVKLVENQMTEGRFYRGLCSHDLMKTGAIRPCKIIRGDITPEQLRKNNILISLGTGIAPFIWVIDRSTIENHTNMLIYTNSFEDQLFYRKICHNYQNNLEEIVSCTREGGKKLIRLIENSLNTIADFLHKYGIEKVRFFYCGPKQIQQFLVTSISSLLGITPQELAKRKLIVYENW